MILLTARCSRGEEGVHAPITWLLRASVPPREENPRWGSKHMNDFKEHEQRGWGSSFIR